MLSKIKFPLIRLTPLKASWVRNESYKEKSLFNIATLMSTFAIDTT